MGKVQILDHPLLQHKLSILRDEKTGVKDFREIVSEIATLMCYEATLLNCDAYQRYISDACEPPG